VHLVGFIMTKVVNYLFITFYTNYISLLINYYSLILVIGIRS